MKHKGNKLKVSWFLAFMVMCILLTGCWSRREIEDLTITIGAAVDVGEETQVEQQFNQEGGNYTKRNLVTLTYQTVESGQGGGIGNKSGGEKKFRNISVTGDSFYEVTREIALMHSHPIFGEHYKVIVVSDKVAREISMDMLFDFFIREQEFRPSCLVLVSKGEARKTLESKNKSEYPAMKLLSISNNHYRSSRLLSPVSLSKLLPKINSSSSFLLQNVISADNEVKFSGAAVIYGKTGKLIGFLNEEELESINWMTAKIKGGVVKAYDEETGGTIIYEITSVKSKIRPVIRGNQISFDVEIESDGRLGEQWPVGNDFDERFIRRVEKAAEKRIRERMDAMLRKVQEQYRADVIGLDEYVRIHYPRTWEKIKKDWDDRFANATINYRVKLHVKEFGTTSIKME